MDKILHPGETNADRKRRSRNAAQQTRMLVQTLISEQEKRAGLIGFGFAVIGFWIVGYFLVRSRQLVLVPFALTPYRSDGQEFRDAYGAAAALLSLPFSIAGGRSAWGKAALVLSIAACGFDFLVYTATALYKLSLG